MRTSGPASAQRTGRYAGYRGTYYQYDTTLASMHYIYIRVYKVRYDSRVWIPSMHSVYYYIMRTMHTKYYLGGSMHTVVSNSTS